MTPASLRAYLDGLLAGDIRWSVMLWGPPGIGKSSVVAQAAAAHGLSLIDLRLSQLAPTDLRGLPYPDAGITRWAPPEFLPRSGRGVIFLDEINLAPPALQGVAQQLVLDRKVGSYVVPDGWFVWAAGNRKEDQAAVFDMPRPLSNRFLHLEIGADLDSFRAYAARRGLHERIVAFLSFRPSLLHRIDPSRPAWPSPRSWEMASSLLAARLDVTPRGRRARGGGLRRVLQGVRVAPGRRGHPARRGAGGARRELGALRHRPRPRAAVRAGLRGPRASVG